MAAISRIPLAWATFNGRLVGFIDDIHNRYGSVVRIAPNELTVIEQSAWDDIYTRRPQFQKDPVFQLQPVNGVDPLFTANDSVHNRQRKILAHAFSDKALREQEPLLQSNVNLLIENLRVNSAKSLNIVNIVKWYKHITLDVMWHLAFGESLHCLESDNDHPVVQDLFTGMKVAFLTACLRSFHPLDLIAKIILSRLSKRKREVNEEFITDSLSRRLHDSTSAQPDFLSYIKPFVDEKGMTMAELVSNTTGFIIAGSESPAGTLCGATYFMLRKPRIIRLLTDEVRGAFKSASEITVSTTSDLPYLTAILQESLRIYQPAPAHLARVVPGTGQHIAGHWIPGGTVIGIPQLAAYVSRFNFEAPDSFEPERWLPDCDARFDRDKKDILKPFSAGPRNCIGKNLAWAEMRLILANIVWNFDMELCDKQQDSWLDQLVFLGYETKPLFVRLTARSL